MMGFETRVALPSSQEKGGLMRLLADQDSVLRTQVVQMPVGVGK